MWTFTSVAIAVVVQPYQGATQAMARARGADDIECVFPDAEVSKIHSGDYLDRRSILREEVALEITAAVSKINNENVKNTVSGSVHHSTYLETWSAMHQLQKHDQEVGD
jgi:hypothetical protein